MKKIFLKTAALASIILFATTSCKKNEIITIPNEGQQVRNDTFTIFTTYTKEVSGVYESVYSGIGTPNVFKMELADVAKKGFGLKDFFIYLTLESSYSKEPFLIPGPSASGAFYELSWLGLHGESPMALIGTSHGGAAVIREIRMVFMPKTISEGCKVNFNNYAEVAKYFNLK